MTMMPRISILTPSYQQADYLEECLLSVQQQQVDGVEHIVMDGGSIDGSRAIIERHAARLAWWCSERDKGQSEAINKGLAHASGDVFTWVNSDDALLPGALRTVADAFAADPALLVLSGTLIHRGPDGERPFRNIIDPGDPHRLFCDPVINQPAMYFRTEAVRAVGGVDPAIRYVMDLELWWQLLFRFGTEHIRTVPQPLAMFRLHAESKTTTSHAGFLAETASILHGMCMATGQPALASALVQAHPPVHGLRGVPVEMRHASIVRDMTVHFLLKWHGVVHGRNDYLAMKALRRVPEMDKVRFLDAGMAARWGSVASQVAAPSWTLFRLRRKLKHLRR